MMSGEALGLELPQSDKRLYAIVETDGCASDGIAVATNCWVGRRTMRVEDYGKVAAAFADTLTGQTIRIAPRFDARDRAFQHAPEARSRWEAMLLGYQRMPSNELLVVQHVVLKTPVEQLISHAGERIVCDRCGEEILNQREIVREGVRLCRWCAGDSYYSLCDEPAPVMPQDLRGL